MEPPSFLPEFFKQCCDADLYLEIGKKCALGSCYDETRPSGLGYWFSLPIRLGLPSDTLIYVHIALLLISVPLSVYALLSINKQINKWSATFLTMTSLALHTIFLWPTLFTTLSDPPSALLMLNGIWLLLLSRNTNTLPNLISITTGSSMIGLAAWIRSFYFYPLLASVAIFFTCFLCLRRERKKIANILIFSALFFPAIQVVHTYKASGKISYLHTPSSNNWKNFHLNATTVGYDTVLPGLAMYSTPQYCKITHGLLPSLKERDYPSLLCLLFNRALFYLATYKNVTFIDNYDNRNILLKNDIKKSTLLTHNIDVHSNISTGDYASTKFTIQKTIPASTDAYIATWISLQAHTKYTFSIWMWSENPSNITIAFFHYDRASVIAKKVVRLTSQPQRFFISSETSNAGNYGLSIGNMPFTNDNSVPSPMPLSLYAWGPQLEAGSAMTAYTDTDIKDIHPDVLRPKRPLLLVANILAIFAALLFLVQNHKTLFANPARLMAVSVVIFSFAQALIIIPEQRFIIAPMIFIWLLACTQLFSCVSAKLRQFPVLS